MTTALVEANYESLERLAALMEQLCQFVEETLQMLSQRLEALENGGWQGEDMQKFQIAMESQLQTTYRLAQSLCNTASIFYKIAETLRQAEEDAASKFYLNQSAGGQDGTGSGAGNGTAPMFPTNISEGGVRLVGSFEGFRGNLYNDPAGHATIGFGHLVHPGPINGSEPDEFKNGISYERGLEILQGDLRNAEDIVRRNVKVPLNQHQFDALVSFAFNVGGGQFAESNVLQAVNAGNFGTVPEMLNMWVRAGDQRLEGLVRRRAAEGNLFANGIYP